MMDNYSREEGFTSNSIVTVFNNKVFYDHSTKKNPNGLVSLNKCTKF